MTTIAWVAWGSLAALLFWFSWVTTSAYNTLLACVADVTMNHKRAIENDRALFKELAERLGYKVVPKDEEKP